MLDDLLGRTELKERIEALEDENHHLERRLEAESERRSDAVAARQRAEERVNRLEDRIADLEGRVGDDTDAGEGASDLRFRHRESLRGGRLEEVLARLESLETGPEGALSAIVPDERSLPDSVAEAFGDRARLVARAAPCVAYADDAGLVSVALRPPLVPDAFDDWRTGFHLERSWFCPVGRFGFALVRADTFALGVYEGQDRESLRGFTTDVKSQHSKGGFSQGRFERIRDGQIRDHVSRCREAVAEADVDRLYVAGERSLLSEFDADATASVDATGDPEEALDDAFHDFWTARLYGI